VARPVQFATGMKIPTNALEVLISQHDEVDELIEEIEGADDADQKAAAFRRLANNLAAHAAIEERLFYRWAMSKQTEPQLREATEEHLAVKRVLADLLVLDVDDVQFDAKLSVMKEQIRHHARDEEEGKLFPKVRRLASQDELDALGGEMLAMFEQLLEGEPARDVPAETEHAAPL